jgi:hypothetical protein
MATTDDADDAEEADYCPKCGKQRGAQETACARCGLLVARWRNFAKHSIIPPSLDGKWAECEARWDDPAVHDAALSAAMAAHALPALARRYRKRLAGGPDKVAETRLSRIAVLAEAAARAQSERVVSPRAQSAWRIAAVIVALAVLAVGILMLQRALAGR